MDPVTRAAQAFLADVEAFWRKEPGRVLPLIADPSVRGEMTKALRLAELAPENRRPLFLYEAPFVDASGYFDRLAEAIAVQYEAIRSGVTEEGLALPTFSMNGVTLTGPEGAVLASERAATLLGERFEGILLALVPEAVANGSSWRNGVSMLTRIPHSSRVRLAVCAPAGGPLSGTLGDGGARFEIDQAALVAYLKDLGARRSKGPSGPPGEVLHEAAGDAKQESSAPGLAVKLRGLLLDAAEEGARGNHAEAARRYREARALCAAGGLVLEEAMVLLGLAGACLAADEPALAVEGYSRAAALATTKDAWQIAAQAWLGMGGAHLAAKRYELAAKAYAQAADVAKRGDLRLLRVEALRMIGTCHVLAGKEDKAIFPWKEAIDLGAALEAGEREASTFSEVAVSFQKLLKRLGFAAQAAHVESLLTEHQDEQRWRRQ